MPDTVFKITTRNLQPITIKETDSNEQDGRGHYDEDKDDEYVTNEERKNTKNHVVPRSRTLKPKVLDRDLHKLCGLIEILGQLRLEEKETKITIKYNLHSRNRIKYYTSIEYLLDT